MIGLLNEEMSQESLLGTSAGPGLFTDVTLFRTVKEKY